MREFRITKKIVDRKNWLGAAVLNIVNEIVLRLKFRRIEVYGRENVPATEPFMLVSNHSSRFDGLMVLRALRRKANYMVSPAELKGYQGLTLPWVGAFPADPRHDLIGFAEAGFRKGEAMVVFPEGTVYYDGAIHPFKLGAARIALAARRDGIPLQVIPASIAYDWERPAVAKIIFGEPVDLSIYCERYEKDPPAVLKNLTESLYREVSALQMEISGQPKDYAIAQEKPIKCWAATVDRVA